MRTIEVRVTISVEHVSGKFAARDEIVEAVVDEIERAELSEVSGVGADGDSEYGVTEWTVEVID